MKISKDREAELIALATNHLNWNDWFPYHNWDGFIEDSDPALTYEELKWLEKNVEVKVVVTKKKEDEGK